MSYVPTPDKDGVRKYGYHFNEKPEDKTRCAVCIFPGIRKGSPHQCRRPRGYGPDGLYCKQHDPAVVQAKRDTQTAKYKAGTEKALRTWAYNNASEQMAKALLKIANGDNDPRTTAREALGNLLKEDGTLR